MNMRILCMQTLACEGVLMFTYVHYTVCVHVVWSGPDVGRVCVCVCVCVCFILYNFFKYVCM